MRLISTLIVTLGFAGAADAHSLDGDHSWVEQLAHQFFGAHHLTLIAPVVAASLVLLVISYRMANRRHR